MNEVNITINNQRLNLAQSLTVRVAMNNFLMWVNESEEDLGEKIQQGYLKNAQEILNLIHKDNK